jgi:preprotein translocase SecE subunit
LNGSLKNITDFLGQVRAEFLKIEWPSFDEFVGSTIITLVIVLFFALFIGGVDRVLAFLAKQIFTYSS